MKKIISVFIFLSFLALNSYAQQVSSDMRTLLSSEGKVLYGEEPNSLVVMDYPENLERVSEYLNVMDVVPQQVLIEARVVEVKLQKESALGVNWQLFAAKNGMKMGQFRVQSVTTDPITNMPTTIGKGVLDQIIPYKKTSYPPGGTATENPFTVSIFDENINVVLNTLASDYNTDILSAPRVTTVNNRSAEMKIIQNYPWAEPQASTDANGNVVVTWTVNFEEIGIILKVAPTINNDGMISMILEPEVSEKTGDLELTTSGVTYKVPIIDKRNASTKVVIGDGQTLIIGGLIKNKTIKGSTKIPFLGDIPGLGYFFKSKNDTTDKTELIIFVSPTVINSQELVHMARQERFGPGRSFAQDRDRQEKMMIVLENKENQNKIKLSAEWDALVKQQRELTESTKWLEQAVFSEENNLKNLEQAKSEVIFRGKKLTPK